MTTADTFTDLVEFWVGGTPKPQGSKRAFHNPKTGRSVVVDDNKAALRDWRGDVKWMALEVMNDKAMIVQPSAVVLTVHFTMPRPLSTPKTKTPLAVKKPDIDKLLRAIMDSLTGVVYNDDAQVIGVHTTKRIAEIGEAPGVLITVREEKL